MEFTVLKTHVGDRRYKRGTTRDMDPKKAKRLIKQGVLADPSNALPDLDSLPENWKSLKADKLKEIAVALGGEDLKTKADAVAHVELLLSEREDQDKPKLAEQDGKWVIMQNDQPVGEPYETEEAAQAALDELIAKAE